MKVVEEDENPASGNGTTSEEEEEECEKVDILDPERKVGNINDLPEELLLEILLCLQPTTLLEVAAVCRSWASAILSPSFWRSRLSRLGMRLSDGEQRNKNWRIFYALCLENPWERNLLRNSSGEESRDKVGLGNRTEEDFHTDWFHSWTVWSSGGSGWGLDGDAGGDMCFLTSNQSCSKEQVVELGKLAPTWWVLDTFQPAIKVEESYMASPGHGAVYEMTVSLLDADRNVLGQPFSFRDDVGVLPDHTAKRVQHLFTQYGKGARFLRFYHAGMASDMEDGWCGPTMWGASVRIAFPHPDTESEFAAIVANSDKRTN